MAARCPTESALRSAHRGSHSSDPPARHVPRLIAFRALFHTMTRRRPAVTAPPKRTLRDAEPASRIALLADPDSVNALPPAGASAHLARFGITARDDDGIVMARATLAGAPILVAAQDERYLAGSVG